MKYDEKKPSLNVYMKFVAVLLFLADMLAVYLASFGALAIRYEMSISSIEIQYIEGVYRYLPANLVITFVIFFCCHFYTSLWKYASLEELCNVVLAVTLAGVQQYLGMKYVSIAMPRSFYILYMLLLLVLEIAIRFSYRFFRFFRNEVGTAKKGVANVMVIGAGDAGAAILKEMRFSKYVTWQVSCFIDDSPEKQGKYIQGCPVVGGRYEIADAVYKYDISKIIIAIPSAGRKEMQEIINLCQKTDCEIQILPGTYQLINGEVSVSQLREVNIDDLLGRDQIRVNLEEILGYVNDKTVMVTGGGGSIGSELCRQLAGHGVRQLIIVDIYENNAYDIQQELKHHFPELNLVVLIASVRNTHRMNEIMETYHPDIVYHAAAHKHVPLMEDSPNEAIKNNVFGTYKTATAAGVNGVKRFVLISTDKAVNPTNIMGASKRICEMIVQMLNHQYDTEFVAVRFGNVLGSNGSVIPLFKKQIAQGGPVTVTHPDIIRYFMTIPEAVSLVLQAGAYAKGGEIFVLDMGEPVKILDLARNLIRLSGYKVGEDIEIKFTGLRPGEKLYEEMLMDEEGMQNTRNQLIHIGKPIEFDEKEFLKQLEQLRAATNQDSGKIRKMVQQIVPTYVIKE
jgi:FlaA1/EpsC-like NDP-sugar epimerase